VKSSRRKTFYELRVNQFGRRVHRLIELEHPDGADARLCQLQATISASEILGRVPTSGELQPVTAQAARKLAKTVGSTEHHILWHWPSDEN
jgi:hypothetical protein